MSIHFHLVGLVILSNKFEWVGVRMVSSQIISGYGILSYIYMVDIESIKGIFNELCFGNIYVHIHNIKYNYSV